MPDISASPIEAGGTFLIGGETLVHRLGFGAMRITGPGIWGPPADVDEAVRVLRRAVEIGVDFIDTADSYGPYVSEELIKEALHPYPAHVVVATKAGMVRTGPERWFTVGRPEYLRQECEMSLRRLGVDQIDLWQLHRIDPLVPAEEQFGVLGDLRAEGKVRHVGLSNVTVPDVVTARRYVPVTTVQNRYNILERDDDPTVAYCQREGIGFIPWLPLDPVQGAASAAVGAVAAQLGASPAQVAIAWLLRRSPVMLPIPGTSRVAHLEQNCAAGALVLSDEQFDKLSGLSRERAEGRA
jgi:pyridoxine 4-dehydrogenase